MSWSKKRIAIVVLLVVLALNSLLILALLFLRARSMAAVGQFSRADGLRAHEPFAYAADSGLAGQGSGKGFSGGWEPGGFNATISDVFTMKPGGLTFSNLATLGANHVSITTPPGGNSTIAGVSRALGFNMAEPGRTYYLSFLYRPEGEEGYGVVVVGTGRGKELSIGRSSSSRQYHISQRGGTGRVYAEQEAVTGETAFLVVKLEFKDGPDRFTLHVNPEPGKPEPTQGVVKEDMDSTEASSLFLYSRANWSVGEIRLGESWEAVTPAQPPSGRR